MGSGVIEALCPPEPQGAAAALTACLPRQSAGRRGSLGRGAMGCGEASRLAAQQESEPVIHHPTNTNRAQSCQAPGLVGRGTQQCRESKSGLCFRVGTPSWGDSQGNKSERL